MNITGIKSICCGNGVRTLPPSKRKNPEGNLYQCLKCKGNTDAYFTTLMSKDELDYIDELGKK